MLDDLRQVIAQVQQGQGSTREEIIRRYLPFVLKITSQLCKRYVKLGVDDEVSIALMAFNEALDKYDLTQKTSFFAFAESVIKRRIIDFFRKKSKENNEIPWSAMVQDEDDRNTTYQLDRLTWDQACSHQFEEEIRVKRREEILEYQKQLEYYGITMQDLVEASPKHQDARIAAYEVARLISENERFRKYLQKTRALPMKELETEVKVSRKTLERQRKYIIAITVILTGEFYFLEDYLEGLKGGQQ